MGWKNKHIRGDRVLDHTWTVKLPYLFEEAIDEEDGLEEFHEGQEYKFKRPHTVKNYKTPTILQIIKIEPGDIYSRKLE